MKTSILGNKDYLLDLISKSKNYCDLLNNAGLTATSGNYKTLSKYLKDFEIIFVGNSKREYTIKKVYSDEKCFSENSEISRHHVKRRIIKNNLIEYKCCECDNRGEWNGKPLVLQLEHINGINNDNRLENLTFICPNCHTQTKTYSAKNKNTRIV